MIKMSGLLHMVSYAGYLFFGSFETCYRTISVNVKYVMIAEYDHDFKPEGGIFYEGAELQGRAKVKEKPTEDSRKSE